MTAYQKNPFTLSFGRKPAHYISRLNQSQKIIETFSLAPVTEQLFVITGVRGSGKTVLMAGIANELDRRDEWIVIRLSPDEDDLVATLCANLYHHQKVHQTFLKAHVAVHLLGIGVNVENQSPAMTALNAIEEMLTAIASRRQKVLIAIDEVTNTPQIRKLASAFQLLIGKEQPIFLLMTGLYENIKNLQDQKNLTFLYRAPKIFLDPLDLGAIRDAYRRVFNIDEATAIQMAKMTKGYPFAFQALGYICWELGEIDSRRLPEIRSRYDQILSEAVYSKIWSELSNEDRKILGAIAEQDDADDIRVQAIRQITGMPSNKFSVYRQRLKERGLLDTRKYGYVSLALPRFADFVKVNA